jgi:hypothetical protein
LDVLRQLAEIIQGWRNQRYREPGHVVILNAGRLVVW